jgi:hypothetical protein
MRGEHAIHHLVRLVVKNHRDDSNENCEYDAGDKTAPTSSRSSQLKGRPQRQLGRCRPRSGLSSLVSSHEIARLHGARLNNAEMVVARLKESGGWGDHHALVIPIGGTCPTFPPEPTRQPCEKWGLSYTVLYEQRQARRGSDRPAGRAGTRAPI